MELSTAITNRRSIRKYDTTKNVSKEQIEELISSAIYAPSWKNSQTSRYYCAVEPTSIDVIKNALPEFNQKRCNGAALIVTTFVHNCSGFTAQGEPENECGNGWGYYDLGLANQNILLKATEMGLGTLVMGIRDAEIIRKALSISDEETIVSVIAVGYTDTNPDMPSRKATDEIITWT